MGAASGPLAAAPTRRSHPGPATVVVCAAVSWDATPDPGGRESLLAFLAHYADLGASAVVLYDIGDDDAALPEGMLALVLAPPPPPARRRISVVRLPRGHRTPLAAARMCHRNHGVGVGAVTPEHPWYVFVAAPHELLALPRNAAAGEHMSLPHFVDVTVAAAAATTAAAASAAERGESGPDAILLPVCATGGGIPCVAVQARAIVRGASVTPVSTRAICAARGGGVVLGPTGAPLPAAAAAATVSCAPREEDACGAPWEVPQGCGAVRLAPRAPPTCCNCTARDALLPAAASSGDASVRAWRRACGVVPEFDPLPNAACS